VAGHVTGHVDAIVRAIGGGMLVMLAGTLPRNFLFAANLRYFARVPWAVPLIAVVLWSFWRYLDGAGPPDSTRTIRRTRLRANSLPVREWGWALLSGGLAIVGLVIALRLVNRLVVLPSQGLPDVSGVPTITLWSLLLMSAPVAGLVEEAAFRGYMQQPLEEHHGITIAILITGTMFAIAHLDFTLVLWPYYVAVAAIYGTTTYLTNSVWPAVVLHTGANVYSNTDLLLHGQAEWQASPSAAGLVWTTGIDRDLAWMAAVLIVLAAATTWSYTRLAAASRTRLGQPEAASAIGPPSSGSAG
jgi:membrane protease YdiL (CAAX protease family)